MSDILQHHSIPAWILSNNIKTEDGTPYTFDDHLFMFEPLQEMSRLEHDLCIYKAAQIGFSTGVILATFWIAKKKAIDIIYTLPTAADVKDFAGGKINRIIAQNPILKKWVKEHDTIEQKTVGNSIIYYRGSFTQKAAMMVSSKLNCYKKDTEVLTRGGWKKVQDINKQDFVATYNESSGGLEYHKPTQLVQKKSVLHKYVSSWFELSVTPDHRMYIQKGDKWLRSTSEELLSSSKFSLGIANTHRESKPFTKFPRYPRDAFFKFMGWYLSEGHCAVLRGRRTGRIHISQKKKQEDIDDIAQTLDEMGVTYCYSAGSFGFSDTELAEWLLQFGKSHDKYIHPELLHDTEHLPLLLDRLYRGDAFRNAQTQYLNTSSKRLADDVQTAWLLLGKMSSVTTVQDKTSRMYRIGIRRHQKIQFNVYRVRHKSGRIEVGNQAEDVYCFTVRNHLVYVRDGKVKVPVISGQCYDEVDSSDQKVIEQYETRQQAEEGGGLQWYFSHPSVPGNGVSKHWKRSDQRHWFITCPHCSKEQYMSWPDSFDLEREEYVCKPCNGTLDRKTRRNGRWVKKYKDREMAGFWIPLWICPWVDAKQIIKLRNTKSEEYFTNKVEGLPYVGRDNKPTYDMITKNVTELTNPQDGWIVIGSDTGIKYHYVVGNRRGLFYYNEGGPQDIRDMLKRWKKSVVVFDAGGDLTEPRKIREEFPGRVFLCHYRADRKTMQLVQWGKGKEEGNVVADRNRMIQLVLNEFQDGLIPLQGTESDWYDYWLSWDDIYRVDEENKLGVIERKWERSNNNDHLVHASVYWRVGMDKFAGASGGVIFGHKDDYQQGFTVNPDMTIPAPDPKRIFKLSSDGS